MVLNYVVEERIITEELQSCLKIFEAAVYKRLTFANESMGKAERFNGGFIGGSRKSHNLFILLV